MMTGLPGSTATTAPQPTTPLPHEPTPFAGGPACPGPVGPASGPATPLGNLSSLDALTDMVVRGLNALSNELARAMTKHPGRAMMMEALAEELGELAACPAAAIDAPGNREALQVACVALRIYMHGAPDTQTRLADGNVPLISLMGTLRAIGRLSHQALHDAGVPD
jgi:hypothetical protein